MRIFQYDPWAMEERWVDESVRSTRYMGDVLGGGQGAGVVLSMTRLTPMILVSKKAVTSRFCLLLFARLCISCLANFCGKTFHFS